MEGNLNNETTMVNLIILLFFICWIEIMEHRNLCKRLLPCFFLVQAINTHKKHGGEHASLKNQKNDA
jgi:hypothetical protein